MNIIPPPPKSTIFAEFPSYFLSNNNNNNNNYCTNIYDSLTSFALFPEEWKGAAKARGLQESYTTLINAPSTSVRPDRKIWQWPGLTKNDIWYGIAKLDNKPSQNVQDIRQSHKFYRENYENLESGNDSKNEKLRWSEDPGRYIPGRCAISTVICNSYDATQKIHIWIQIY